MRKSVAVRAIEALRSRGATVACAESLTGGRVCASLVDVPGASSAVRGGVVAYSTDVKRSLLKVSDAMLDTHGPVHGDVAGQMARSVAQIMDADYGLSTTGVAGPGPSDGYPAGTAFIAVSQAGRHIWVRRLALVGDRSAVRAACVDSVLALLLGSVTDEGTEDSAGALR